MLWPEKKAKRINDNYSKYLVSLDEPLGTIDVRRIKHMNLRDFFVEDLG